MSVTIYHRGDSPISAATIWAIDGDYLPVEWTVLLASLLSAAMFVIAVRLAPTGNASAARLELLTIVN
ncbi:hypothetical protein RI103_33830 [Paraburkholderia sp. FT54]|uniref:hypothetical protein n=1 Tax=Paraburkholderia sp. FT54 TaxID=3074437 RepID=UPI002877C978|nr:hypothetical protein [Paraburkholderia sp. FT54]WNC94889.1 hypothetical protein RI103_33830 [Paraburkholderia sp. FT54]